MEEGDEECKEEEEDKLQHRQDLLNKMGASSIALQMAACEEARRSSPRSPPDLPRLPP